MLSDTFLLVMKIFHREQGEREGDEKRISSSAPCAWVHVQERKGRRGEESPPPYVHVEEKKTRGRGRIREREKRRKQGRRRE